MVNGVGKQQFTGRKTTTENFEQFPNKIKVGLKTTMAREKVEQMNFPQKKKQQQKQKAKTPKGGQERKNVNCLKLKNSLNVGKDEIMSIVKKFK